MLAPLLRRWLRRGLALMCSLFAGLLVGEGLLRLADPPVLSAAGPVARFPPDHPYHPDAGRYLLDDELGYRPNPAHPDFHPTGCLAHSHVIERPEHCRRLLVLGDSVIERGHVGRALAAELEPGWEVWSLGVSGYSTPEEVVLFERVVDSIQPDRVLLLFSYNDLSRTPLRFVDDTGRLVLVFAKGSLDFPASWIHRSALARLLLALEARWDPMDEAEHRSRIRGALERLQRVCSEHQIALSAAVQPLIAPSLKLLRDPEHAELRTGAEARHERNLVMFADLAFPFVDLRATIVETLGAGLQTGEHAGDMHHPSPELATRYAAQLAPSLARGSATRGRRP